MLDKLLDTLLTREPIQRGRLQVWAAGALSYLLCSAVQALEVAFGLMERRASDPLIVGMLGSSLVFYAIFRARLNLRWGSDPGMTLLQLSIGCGFSLWSYAVTGPARGAILMLLISNMVYGVFSLTAQQSHRLAFGALAVLATVMVSRVSGDPSGYPWQLEVVHFLFSAIVMWTMTSLSGQLSALRAKLGRQAHDLKEAMEKLKLLATRDELTKLRNRRHMIELMTYEVAQSARSGAPICLALLDIDLFKSINDRHGHAAGDKVLQIFARVAQEELRSSDLLCRWGGEEFLVLFPSTTTELAQRALQRLHLRLAQEVIDVLDPGQRVSFSAGLTAYVSGETVEAATERADQGMYGAKTAGRSRTMLVPTQAGAPEPARAPEMAA